MLTGINQIISVNTSNNTIVINNIFRGSYSPAPDSIPYVTKIPNQNPVNFVAVSYVSTGNSVITSPDGLTWTWSTLSSRDNWSAVAYGRGRFVAIGGVGNSSDTVVYSSDGINWSTSHLPSSRRWSRLTYNGSAGSLLFVAVSDIRYDTPGSNSFVGGVAYSDDGINWASANLPNISVGSGQVFSCRSLSVGNGKEMLIGGIGTTNVKAYIGTASLSSWTDTSIATNYDWNSAAYGNGIWVAVQSTSGAPTNQVAYSTNDASTWSYVNLATTRYLEQVTYGQGKFVAITSQESGQFRYGFYANATTPLSWANTQQSLPSLAGALAFSSAAGRFSIASGGGDTGGSGPFPYSTDGVTWTWNTATVGSGGNTTYTGLAGRS
jgi:hypothetical protein